MMVSMQLPKAYEPGAYEKDIYALWEKSGAFTPRRAGNSDSFTIMMPLPNANGKLHIGHVLFLTLQDIVTRYQRMRGKAALWLPGADHAGFETWVVYEKKLEKEGKSRFDFTREEIYKQVWDFVAGHKSEFENQFRTMGASVDWTRFTFSLDDRVVRTVYDTFKKMWDDGLVYRGERLVNFCTTHGTSFSDIEVEYKEVNGKLWYIRYPLTKGSGEIVVATTRPETMLGDAAVAVNPDDKRYKDFIGNTLKLPLTNREIPLIADKFVESEFGSGAVKITPAHDQDDFEAAERHDLPRITVIDHRGKLTHEVPAPYRGLPAEEARKKVVEDLQRQGLLVKTEGYTHSVGHCYKCGTVIQPLLREQWFIDVQPLAAKAIETLKANKITFYPAAKKDQLSRYLEGLKDWNISRQIAWGIPIPAFVNTEDPRDWIYDERVGDETIEVTGKTYRRDPDVFDTWFSSGQWPYATLAPIGSDDFKQFYPGSLMETGGEILFPWVSRMIMLGLYVTGEVPFKDVYIHGYVLAEDGSKMSKSLGNVVDPEGIRQKYGTDALRLGLIDGRAPAVNRPYDETKTVAARNFANKLWNVARFIEEKGSEDIKFGTSPAPKTNADEWILHNLNETVSKITADLDSYRFAEAYDRLYHFVWDDFADWYIETSKRTPNLSVLSHVLETVLKLAHPFAPFVTETIWQTLNPKGTSLLITAIWPMAVKADSKKAGEFEEIKAIVTEIRAVMTALGSKKLSLYYSDAPFIAENAELLKHLAKLVNVGQVKAGHGLHLTSTRSDCWLDVDPTTAQRYAKKLEAQKAEQEKLIAQLESRLSNKEYLKKAPSELVNETKAQLVSAKEQLGRLAREYERFSGV